MPNPTNQELINQWRNQPAPLLPLLHSFQDRDGHLSEETLRDVAVALRIPLADLFGTVTFYHHFARTPLGQNAPRVCTGPACRLAGGEEILEQLSGESGTPMPCAGRCDDAVPVLKGHTVLTGTTVTSLKVKPSPLPLPNPDGFEECVFDSIREPGRSTIDGYQRTGGYQALMRAIREMGPADTIELLVESKLAGRGGAGFPTGLKWRSVAEAPGEQKTIVCNADEGEPGCFKDRAILDYDPHAIIEGMTLAAYATRATRGFIYLRYEYPTTLRTLESAISEAKAAGFVGDKILGTNFTFDIYVRRGAGAYICGEEGSLLNSLEGKHPFPRNRPPYPVTHGFENSPTAVNNVETLASVPQIIRRGAEWYQQLGLNGHAGTKVISLSGDIQKPGNYEVPFGLSLQTLLYEWANGPHTGRSIQAVTMAGLSGGFLAGNDLCVTLDEPSIQAKGSMLGAGGILVFDDTRDVIKVAQSAMEFFAEESCGKCFPCRIGTQRLSERLAGKAGPSKATAWINEVNDIGHTMKATSACGLGMAAPLIAESLLRYFPEKVKRHVES